MLLNYLPSQKEDARQIYNQCNEETQAKIKIDFYEDNLRDFLAITSFCNALIGNEGGATNMAKALDIPTFTIFSPFVPKNDWNMFENETTTISVHIRDYFPNSSETDTTESLYNLFELNLFEDKLEHFIKLNCI